MTLCGLFVTNIDLSAQLRFTQGHSNEICSEPFGQSMKRFVCTLKQTLNEFKNRFKHNSQAIKQMLFILKNNTL